MMRHTPVLEAQIERAALRNAQLITALRHAAQALHLIAADHPRTVSWAQCAHPTCARVRAAIDAG